MTQWYKNNQKLFREEKETLAIVAPRLEIIIADKGFKLNRESSLKHESAVVHGIYRISVPDSAQQFEYGISLFIPEKYPNQPPIMFCNDPKLPTGNIDRHIMRDGSACLGVYGDILLRWGDNSNMANFLENFVAPFLVWQIYYDAYQKPPPWGQRSHFSKGIMEFYAEFIGIPNGPQIIEFMKLLARKNCPKGHETCPCGSGKRLRNCHRDLLYDIRERVSWQYVAHDLAVIFRDGKDKSYYQSRIISNGYERQSIVY